MAVINLLVKQYAVCIYINGTRKISTVAAGYVEPVKEYAAETYTLAQIDNALVKGFVTEAEYTDTIAYSMPVVPDI